MSIVDKEEIGLVAYKYVRRSLTDRTGFLYKGAKLDRVEETAEVRQATYGAQANGGLEATSRRS